MILGLDLDGVFYDTRPLSYQATQKLWDAFEVRHMPLEEWQAVFQANDWRKFYSDAGFSEEQIPEVMQEFYRIWHTMPEPELVPNGKETLEWAIAQGRENLYVITNNNREKTIARFIRD